MRSNRNAVAHHLSALNIRLPPKARRNTVLCILFSRKHAGLQFCASGFPESMLHHCFVHRAFPKVCCTTVLCIGLSRKYAGILFCASGFSNSMLHYCFMHYVQPESILYHCFVISDFNSFLNLTRLEKICFKTGQFQYSFVFLWFKNNPK